MKISQVYKSMHATSTRNCSGSVDDKTNREVTGSNLLAAAVVPLGEALYPRCLVPRKGLKCRWFSGCWLMTNLLS